MSRLYLALPLLLAACGPLVQIGGNAPKPVELYTLSATPPTSVSTGQALVDPKATITIDVPTVPGALQTMRIPVTVSDTAIQYLVGAQWSEQPNRLFQRLVADVVATGGVPVIDQRADGRIGARRLTGQLQSFGLDSRAGRQVIVRYDATLSTADGVRQRRFERSQAVGSADPGEVTTALNNVANAVAADVAKWVSAA